MVSSKCLKTSSPSPLRFLAALMPPWAQTECERFTGTMENKSTCPPISAILMTAESPASPPPITMIFGAAAIVNQIPIRPGPQRRDSTHHQRFCAGPRRFERLQRSLQEGQHGKRPHPHEHQPNHRANIAKPPPRPVAGGNPPFGGEQPQSVGKMPGGANDAESVERYCPRTLKLQLNLAERRGGMA